LTLKESCKPNLYLALVHYPVINKAGDVIASAVTNLDLHDMARAGKTFGIKKFYIVTPLEDQITLVTKIVDHWTRGGGAVYNGLRKEALDLICVQKTLSDTLDHIRTMGQGEPKTIMTSARDGEGRTGFKETKALLANGNPYLLVVGTAWGLADSMLAPADYILQPIVGNTGYNHLSVRSAAAIILDRLLGPDEHSDTGKHG
jgi:hypothetical protein